MFTSQVAAKLKPRIAASGRFLVRNPHQRDRSVSRRPNRLPRKLRLEPVGIGGLRSSWCVFHGSSSSAGRRSWARSSATSETTPGSIRVTSRSAFLPLYSRTSNPLAPPGRSASPRHVGPGSGPGSSGGNLLRLARPSAAPPRHGAEPTPADHAIQPLSPVGGRGIGGEYLGRLTMARSRLRACDI
jgi:hypothetical protein